MRVARALAELRRLGRPALVPYVMVDRARRRTWEATARALRAGGASAVELGFPFSDPIADGPVLEAAAERALAHGTTWADLLAALDRFAPVLPTAVMTYANPVWRHGLEPAFADLRAHGATALVVPDLSFEESAPWRTAARVASVDLALLAAPVTGAARTVRLARATRGFLYLVARYGTTGRGAASRPAELARLVQVAHGAAPRTSVLVGFGVRDRASAVAALATGADGVIVGSALEERFARSEPLERTARWLGSLVS